MDKLASSKPEVECRHYQRTWGSKIVKLYRKGARKREDCPKDVSFGEFMRYFARNNGLLHDNHLISYEHCHPCHVSFDQVMRLETAENDIEYLTENFFKTKNTSALHLNTRTKLTKLDLQKYQYNFTVKAFQNVSMDNFENIKTLYKRDAELFGYSSQLDPVEGLIAQCRYKNTHCC
jgi:hypothetical protein